MLSGKLEPVGVETAAHHRVPASARGCSAPPASFLQGETATLGKDHCGLGRGLGLGFEALGREFSKSYKYNKATLWAEGRGLILLISLMKTSRGQGEAEPRKCCPHRPHGKQSPADVPGPACGISAWPGSAHLHPALSTDGLANRAPTHLTHIQLATSRVRSLPGKPLTVGEGCQNGGTRDPEMDTCTYLYTHICIDMYVYTHVYTHTQTHVYITFSDQCHSFFLNFFILYF